MTQESLIKALQDGPKTSLELRDSTDMSQQTLLSTAKKLRYKGILTTEQVKVGRYWVAKYTLTDKAPKKDDKTIICGIQTYGIFTAAEYRVMNAQARAHLRNVQKLNGITNNQRI